MKRLLLLLLPLILWSSIALAHDIEVDGIYYDFTNNNTELSVTSGETKYSGNVVIPESVTYNGTSYPVTSIGEYAFIDCSGLTSITIGNSVTTIGSDAFRGCSGLTSVTIPNSVTSIEARAFRDCVGLTSITIPNSVTSIGGSAFFNCARLTSVTIGNSVTSIGENAFFNCSGLTKVNISDMASWCKISFESGTANPLFYAKHLYLNGSEVKELIIPNSVTSIGGLAFYNCSGLTSVTIGNSVTTIGNYAFSSCSGLTSVTIPNSVTSIGGYAFSSCSGLTSVTIGNSVNTIGNYAFSSCSGLTSVTIPNSVTSIGENAFYRTNLTGVTINSDAIISKSYTYNSNLSGIFGDLVARYTVGNDVKSIGNYAFYNSKALSSVSILSSVTSIGNDAFSGCSRLTSVTIGNSVTSIAANAFFNCSGLTKVNISDMASWCKISFESGTANPLFYAKHLYLNGSEVKELIIPNSVTSIGENAFYNCSGLTSVTIPNSVTSIGYSAFYNCSGLTSVAIPNSVTSIGYSAFYNCSGLTSVIIPNSVTSIGSDPFSNCNNLKKIFVTGGELLSYVKKQLPTAIIYYMDDNFYSDGNNFYILDNTNYTAKLVNTIAQGDCTIPKFIKVGDELQKQYNLTSIAKYAMYGNQIQSLTIGENIETIESEALKNKPIKTIWLTNTPPSGYSNVEGNINYVANDQYTSISNTKVYPYISSIFEVDGITYVPVNPSERTCDAIDCLYDNTIENLHIGKEVSFKGVSMKVNKIQDYIAISNPFIKTLSIDSDNDILLQAFKDCENLETVSLTNKGNVGKYAFSGCKKLNLLVLNNQGNINDYAFSGCEGLETIYINNSGSIEQYAFANLKIQTVSFGNNVTTLGDRSFSGCENLKTIDLPDNIKSIGNSCFNGCSLLSEVNIGNGVQTIGAYAFSGCSNLNKIILGGSLTTIENYLFNNCSSLTDIEIPNSVSSVGDYTFSGCTTLKKVTFKDSNTALSLGRNGSNPLFADCPLDNVYIGRDISYNTSSSYGYSPFYRNISLHSVTFSDKETEISNYEFYGCSGLKNVIIGNGVTAIGDWAFSGCSSLEYFSFGANVKNIGKEAFSDCTAMTRLESHANTPPTCGSQALDDINKWNCQLYVPETSLSAYQSADQWKDFFFINTLTVDPLLKDMLELRIKSDSLITSYNSNNGGSTSGGTITNNVDSLSKATFTTPPTGLLTSASQLSSNAKATNEGSYEALLDGNQTTYFHTTWLSGKGDAPNEDHYLQIDLQEEVERIALKYGARGSITNYVNPNNITIYATNNVNGNWTQITTATLTYDNNSNGKGLLSIDLGGKYRYIRISVQSSTLSSSRTINGHSYWCLGELRIYNIGTGSQEGTGTEPQGNDEKPQVPKEVVENLQNCINAAGTEISTNAATQSTYDALLSAYNTFLGYLNESTDVERIYTNPSVDVWYDLQGRRITKPQTSGIYIHNGKKVWVK